MVYLTHVKKQKLLYKHFLSKRTKESETKYKTYKNKLTYIKRCCEKQYYSKLLSEKKNDIKATWKILNSVIKKKQPSSNDPDSFNDNGTKVTDKVEIANKFNDFFVNVGPNLAKNINHRDNANIHK